MHLIRRLRELFTRQREDAPDRCALLPPAPSINASDILDIASDPPASSTHPSARY